MSRGPSPRILVLSAEEHGLGCPQPYYLAMALRAAGARVAFAGPLGTSSRALLDASGVEARDLRADWPAWASGVRFRAAYARAFLGFVRRLWELEASRADLVVGVGQSGGRAAWLLERAGRARSYALYLVELFGRWLGPAGKAGGKAAVARGARLTLLSNDQRRQLYEQAVPAARERTAVLLNTPPRDWPGEPVAPVSAVPGRLTLGYVGSLGPATGLAALLQAVARGPADIRLRIGGIEREPGYRDSLVGLGQRLGIGQRIAWAGAVPREELHRFLAPSHLTVCFYPWRAPGTELNFVHCAPNKVYESFALGRAALVSDNASLGFVERDGLGFAAEVESPERLVAVLARIDADRASVVAAGARAREAFLGRLNFEAAARPVVEALLAIAAGERT